MNEKPAGANWTARLLGYPEVEIKRRIDGAGILLLAAGGIDFSHQLLCASDGVTVRIAA